MQHSSYPSFIKLINKISLYPYNIITNKVIYLLPNVRKQLDTIRKEVSVQCSNGVTYWSDGFAGFLKLRKQVKVTWIHVRWIWKVFQALLMTSWKIGYNFFYKATSDVMNHFNLQEMLRPIMQPSLIVMHHCQGFT